MGHRRAIIAACGIGSFYLLVLLFQLSSVPRISHVFITLIAGYFLTWGLYSALSSLPYTELWKRFSLTTGALILTIMVAEIPAALRLIDYRAVFGAFDPTAALSVAGRHADPELLWHHDPYYHYEEPYQGNLGRALCLSPDVSKRIAVRYDRNGFRNPKDFYKADIVVIGDSYIEGYMTEESRLATSYLAKMTGKVVANLGHSGYGPQQELVVLKRYGLPLNPSVVIWAFFQGNDIMDAERYERQRTLQRHRKAIVDEVHYSPSFHQFLAPKIAEQLTSATWIPIDRRLIS